MRFENTSLGFQQWSKQHPIFGNTYVKRYKKGDVYAEIFCSVYKGERHVAVGLYRYRMDSGDFGVISYHEGREELAKQLFQQEVESYARSKGIDRSLIIW